ncbi:MAG: hypothetical protein PHU06_05775 [Gallionella sp.]|nr:hypothetical protein [Gallionella sp.]
MKHTPPPVAYSPRQLLNYWFIWILGNEVCAYLSAYLHTYWILAIWSISIIFAQGYLYIQLHRPHHTTRIQLEWQLLFFAGVMVSFAEGFFTRWFVEGCLESGSHCFGLVF